MSNLTFILTLSFALAAAIAVLAILCQAVERIDEQKRKVSQLVLGSAYVAVYSLSALALALIASIFFEIVAL
jgi:hypothetical protein